AGTATGYLEKIRAIESAQGRDASGVTAESNPRIYISDSIAERLKKDCNGEDVLSYTSSFSIGYKIDPGTNTASFYTINTYQSGGAGQGYAYVPSRSNDWQGGEDDPCVPLYSNHVTGYVTRAEVVSETTIQEYDDTTPSNSWTKQTVSNSDGTVSFAYIAPSDSTASFTLSVDPATDNDVEAQESFEVEFNVNATANPLYGSKVTIKYRIYFNQGWLPQDTGVLEFTNNATYELSSDTATGEYTFTGGGSSAAITADPKRVSHQFVAHGGATTLLYELPFKKSGNDAIDKDALRVYDSISQYLELLIGTIRIKHGDQYVSTSGSYFATASGVGLSVTYNETNHQLFITNDLADITTDNLITVEFKARVHQDVKYGTQITNTFAGRTVETTVDHRLNIRKVDAAGDPVAAPATFSIFYTTDDPSGQSPAMETLLDTNGQQVPFLTTSNTGIASLEYRLDEDEFYLKIEETNPPSGYAGLSGSIWIKATRNIEGEMSYTLAAPLPTGIEQGDLIVNGDGSVSLAIKNTTTPSGGGNTPPGGGDTPPGGGDTPLGGGDTPPSGGGNHDDDDPSDPDEPPRFDLHIRKTVAGSIDDDESQKLFRFQIVNTGEPNSRYGTGLVPLSIELTPGAMQVTGNGIDEDRIISDEQGKPTILLLRHNETATIQNLYGGFYQIAELDTAGYTTTYSVDSRPEAGITSAGRTRELYFSADAQVTFKNTVNVEGEEASPHTDNRNPLTGGVNYNPQTGGGGSGS
ncbi:MAG: hypothetical protein LBV27_08590, partial [Oscillospiraceae bacterium]|nr:hypothetical protein [Oscillospiraceae bacterium]